MLSARSNHDNSDNGIEAIVKELVAIYDKAGRLEAMHGEDGVRSRCGYIARCRYTEFAALTLQNLSHPTLLLYDAFLLVLHTRAVHLCLLILAQNRCVECDAICSHKLIAIRLASYYEPGAPDRLTKAQAFLELVKRRFGAKMAQKDDL